METVRFGELYAIPSGNGLSRPTAVRGEGFRMIGMGELFANDIITDMEMDRVKMSEKEKKNFFVEEGDLLFARQSLVASGAGKCSIVKQFSESTTYESHLIRVRLDKSKCNPWFYYYLFKLQNNPIKAIINQCAQAGIRGNELIRVKVPLVELGLQNRIVSVLLAYDNLIETNNKRIKTLELMAENLYKEWFVRFRFPGHETTEFKNSIPKGWLVSYLSDILCFGSGKVKPETGLFYPVYGGNGITDWCDYYNYENIIVIGRVGAYSGSVYYVPDKCWVSDNALFAKRKKEIEEYNYYDYFLLKYLNLPSRQGGTGQPLITQSLLSKIRILNPPKEIIEKYCNYVKPYFQIKYVLNKQNENLIKQRDLLLPRLMSGKLEV